MTQHSVLLPLTSDTPVLRGGRVRVASNAARDGLLFSVEHILVDTTSGPWLVHGLEIDGRPQLRDFALNADLFSSPGAAVPARGRSARIELRGFDVGDEVALIVSYVGENPEGAVFHASAFGTLVEHVPLDVIEVETLAVPNEGRTTVRIPFQDRPFSLKHLTIDSGNDWVVHDIRVAGRTQFQYPGGIPGDIFALSALESFVRFDVCPRGAAIEIDVQNLGPQPSVFKAKIEGKYEDLASGGVG